MGANDHSTFGYLLRLYLLGAMPPVAWGADGVYSMVDVDALANGLCLAVERAPPGEDYLFCGEPVTVRGLLEQWDRFPGGMKSRAWVPRWLVRPMLALLEPLQRAAGLPAFLSRDAVDASRAHLNYSSAKARRDLGWSHPPSRRCGSGSSAGSASSWAAGRASSTGCGIRPSCPIEPRLRGGRRPGLRGPPSAPP